MRRSSSAGCKGGWDSIDAGVCGGIGCEGGPILEDLRSAGSASLTAERNTTLTRPAEKASGWWRRLAYLRDLLWVLVGRDMKLRYKRSVLGFAWSLLNPLAQLLVFSFVFITVLPLNIPNYVSFLFSGLLSWNWFNTSLFTATDAIVANRELVRRPGFPVAILPLITVTSNLVNFLLALPILLLFLPLSGVPPVGVLVYLPCVIAIQFVFTLSLAYLVATVHVTFRDTQYLLGILLLLGFYLTPVFYDASAIPARFQAAYGLNPMLHLIGAYRAILLHGQQPDMPGLAMLAGAATLLLLIGYRVFTRASDRFAEEI
jgi:lipopolysaccharide transport system permease protein